jgi:hypothetical protein
MEDKITQLEKEIAEQEKLLSIAIDKGDKYKTYDEFEIAIAPFQAKIRALDRELRMILPVKLMHDIEPDDDVMSLKEFIEAVKSGLFIDFDGWGRYVKDGKKTNIQILPSDIKYRAIRKEFDTIVWFNK